MEYNKKVIVIGDIGVGKTSFVARVTEGRFISEYKSTVGADCAVKIIKKPNNVCLRISLWDLAGQESFKSLMPMYARGCDGVIIVCDVSSQTTVESVSQWKSLADTALVDCPPCILLVNKFDLPQLIHCVTNDQVDKLCEECRLNGYYETSVKENVNLQIALDKLSDLMLAKNTADCNSVDGGITLHTETYNKQHSGSTHKRHYSDKKQCCV